MKMAHIRGAIFVLGENMNGMLVIVDPQNDFINGALPVPGAEKAMNDLAEYVKENGKKYSHIVVTCDYHPVSHCSFLDNGGQWPPHCVAQTSGAELWPPLQNALEGMEYETLHKGDDAAREEYSIFRNPHARMRLMDLSDTKKVEHYDICGIAGDYCVLQTLKDGSEIFGANKFQVLCDYSPSIDGGKALDEFIKEKSICIK